MYTCCKGPNKKEDMYLHTLILIPLGHKALPSGVYIDRWEKPVTKALEMAMS